MDFRKFLAFLNEYNKHYRELLEFETSKLSLIARDKVDELRNLLNAEQAIVMKTNQLEKERLSILPEEYKNKTLQELEALAPNELKGQYHQAYVEMSKLVFQIKKVNKDAQEIVAAKLKSLEQERAEAVGIYTKSGSKNQYGQSVTIDKGI